MYVERLEYKRWRGQSLRFNFIPEINMMVGLNGSGKTSTLDLIAIMSGHDDAPRLLIHPQESIEFARIVLRDDKKTHELVLEDGFDLEKIAEFKSTLPNRSSFVLQHDLRDDRLTTERREPVECHKEMLELLENYSLGLSFVMERGRGASCLVSETGAQNYLLHVGMRRAPATTPMLVDLPERSLHIMLRRSIITDYYCARDGRNQLIGATHCPEIISRGTDDRTYGRRYGERDFHVISMDEKSLQW